MLYLCSSVFPFHPNEKGTETAYRLVLLSFPAGSTPNEKGTETVFLFNFVYTRSPFHPNEKGTETSCYHIA